MHTHKDWVYSMPFFDGCPDSFVANLALSMNLRTYHPKELVYDAGDPAEELFVVKRGLVGSRGNPVAHGNVFGVEIFRHLIYEPVQRTHKAVTLTYVECYACPIGLLKDALRRSEIAKKKVIFRAMHGILTEQIYAFAEASQAFMSNQIGRSKNPLVREMEEELLYRRSGIRKGGLSHLDRVRPRYAKQLVRMQEHMWNIGHIVANLEAKKSLNKAPPPPLSRRLTKKRPPGAEMIQVPSPVTIVGKRQWSSDPIARIVASHPGFVADGAVGAVDK